MSSLWSISVNNFENDDIITAAAHACVHEILLEMTVVIENRITLKL